MAFEIKNIDGVICLKGKITTGQLQEIKKYFQAFLQFQSQLKINICGVSSGHSHLQKMLEGLKSELDQDKSLLYFGYTDPRANIHYLAINHPSNFYHAA